MKNILIFIFFNFYLLSFENLNAKIKNKIVVKVGSEVITNFEVKNKILSTLIVSNTEINQENINKIKGQILNELINVKLKKNEIKNKEILINKDQVNAYLNAISSNNLQKLKQAFKENNLNFDLFVQDIEIEFKWQKFIYSKYSNKIEVDEATIVNEINKILKNKLFTREVNISEIQVANYNNSSEKKLIENIENEIQNNGFENTALKFSISNTSSEKGNLGWINLKTLSKEMYNILKDMRPGEISKPIKQSNGILFLKLNDSRQVSGTDLNEEKLKNNLIKKRQNEMFNLYSMSHLSIIKNKYLIEYK
tara:strand:+ start:1990 stop:2916 length:927 start_codon:yes stop_codon:yes gene_type:complete